MVTIHAASCTGCKACVQDCIFHNLILQEGKAKALGSCIRCGHCVAICPENAVSIPEYDMVEVKPYEPDSFRVPAANFLNHVKFRRSVRRYKPQTVEKDKLQRVLQAGRYTATAVNLQDVRFIVVREQLAEFRRRVWQAWEKVVDGLAQQNDAQASRFGQYLYDYRQDPDQDRLFLGAPVAVILAADVPLDAGLAAANVENMAVCEGLGALYNGYVIRAIEEDESLGHWLQLEGKKAIACLLLGYPAVRYRRTAPRRPIDAIWR